MRTIQVETGFNADVPSLVDERGEFFDEGAAQARLTATEGHTAASGEEIEVVDGKFLSEFIGGHLAQDAVGTQALGVETIAAAKCTAMKGHQGGDSLAIDRQPVTGYPNDRGFEHRLLMELEFDGEEVFGPDCLAALSAWIPFGHETDDAQDFFV